MQGGPRRGRSPITGPTLPRAAQASQLRRRAKQSARRAETIKRTSLAVRRNRAPHRRPNFAGRRPPLPEGPQVQEGSASDIAIRKPTKKGASPSACPLACPCQENKSTSSPLQPLAAPAPEHAQAKAVRPRQRPCQTTASPRACRFLRQGPRAWKAPAAPPDSAKACRRP